MQPTYSEGVIIVNRPVSLLQRPRILADFDLWLVGKTASLPLGWVKIAVKIVGTSTFGILRLDKSKNVMKAE